MTNTYFQNSPVWQKSIDLVEKVYAATLRFPHRQNHALGLQMQKTSVSLASTIAEAARRDDTIELMEFMGNAHGSLARLKTQMIIAEHDNFIDKESYARLHEMCNDLSVMLRNLLQPPVAQSPRVYEPS